MLVVPLWNWLQNPLTPGYEVTDHDPGEHAEEDPQGEVAVEKAEPAGVAVS